MEAAQPAVFSSPSIVAPVIVQWYVGSKSVSPFFIRSMPALWPATIPKLPMQEMYISPFSSMNKDFGSIGRVA